MNTKRLTNDTLCDAASEFFTVFEYPADVDKVKLQEVIGRGVAWYCQFNPQSFVEELNKVTNFEALMYEVCCVRYEVCCIMYAAC